MHSTENLENQYKSFDMRVFSKELGSIVSRLIAGKTQLISAQGLKDACRELEIKAKLSEIDLRFLDESSIPIKEFISSLNSVAETDSQTRDIITSGHLYKLVSRFNHTAKLDFEKVGLPEEYADKLTEAERTEFFLSGKTLSIWNSSSGPPL